MDIVVDNDYEMLLVVDVVVVVAAVAGVDNIDDYYVNYEVKAMVMVDEIMLKLLVIHELIDVEIMDNALLVIVLENLECMWMKSNDFEDVVEIVNDLNNFGNDMIDQFVVWLRENDDEYYR
jgi:hypothetical protein